MTSATFNENFSRAAAACRELTVDEARHFVDHGFVAISAAFPGQIAASICDHAWQDLYSKHQIMRDDPGTWIDQPRPDLPINGYIRTAGSGRRYRLKDVAPRAWQTQIDLVGGPHRLPDNGASMSWGDEAIANLGPDPRWKPPVPRQHGWHKDGWHFRHFLGSPEQGLLTVPIFTDILPKSGGTVIATDSIAPVARLLAGHPEGLHADSVQGAGYLIPGLIEQCSEFVELTGNAGDMVLLHPYMLHRPCANPSGRPRFIANHALVLSEPMQFNRPERDYSLVELTVLRALGSDHFDYRPTRPMQALAPAPFRDRDAAATQKELLKQEMLEMARAGIVTPEWATEAGYHSNRDVTESLVG